MGITEKCGKLCILGRAKYFNVLSKKMKSPECLNSETGVANHSGWPRTACFSPDIPASQEASSSEQTGTV